MFDLDQSSARSCATEPAPAPETLSAAETAGRSWPIVDGDVWLPLDALRPWEGNPRHNDGRPVERVAESIRRFGFVAPIVVWRGRNRIVAGHTRLKALRKLVAEEPGFTPHGAPGPGLARVVFHEFADDAEADAYAIADNRLGELARWDTEKLDEVLARLTAEDRVVVGFDDPLPAASMLPASTWLPESRSLGTWTIHRGDLRALQILTDFPDNHFDALLSDPPYGLSPDRRARTWDDLDALMRSGGKGYIGEAWDAAVPGPTFWREVLRVLKPGAPILAFGGTRSRHRLVGAIEDAGFEIVDEIDWYYGNGMTKSNHVSMKLDGASNRKRWAGYGTALKPAREPAVLARKPLDGRLAENVEKWDVGPLNIAACRFGVTSDENAGDDVARFPTNVIISEQGSAELETQSGNPSLHGCFYVAKPLIIERELGTADLQKTTRRAYRGWKGVKPRRIANTHPTVKPIALTRYLATLLLPPPRDGGTRRILVPFCGSGSEMIGALLAGWDDVHGIENDPEYIEIARARVAFAAAHPDEFDVARGADAE
jgi:site-specific DNA-methyltransferase (adenine-specific)